MSLLVGVVGKPNAGKSTFFSALTMVEAKVAPFPFTTLEPNRGVGYVRRKCPRTELGKECSPRDSFCRGGTRFVPVQLLDVAGLVPDAHKGRGLGFQFLDDLRTADGFIHVVDASGSTDLEGNPAEAADPAEEVMFLRRELEQWFFSVIERNWKKVRLRGLAELADVLTGLKVTAAQAEEIAKSLSLPLDRIDWDGAERLRYAEAILKHKPMVVAANKADSGKDVSALQRKFPEMKVIPCSALYELVLRKAEKAGIAEYAPGSPDFAVKGAGSPEQGEALGRVKEFISAHGSTGVQQALEELVFGGLKQVSAFPVEDEGKWTDRKGAVLPNVHLLPEGSTALDLAGRVHTDLASNFICAVDGRSKRRLGKDYKLKDLDVLKIVSGR